MTNTPTPASHAVNTAPISADLRGMNGLSEQDAALLEQAASMLEGLHNDERHRGNCSTAEGAACSADAVRRLAVQLLRAGEPAQCLHQIAEPAPATYMTEDAACDWAWEQARQDVGTESWTAGDSGNFFGFFLWGWIYRGQYEAQRAAGAADVQRVLAMRAAPASPAQQDALTWGDIYHCMDDIRALLARQHKMHHSDFITELAGIVTATPRQEDDYAAAPAQAQQDAPAAVAVPAVRDSVARAIWSVMREHEDRCDMELEDMGEHCHAWALADAALAAAPAAPAADMTLVTKVDANNYCRILSLLGTEEEGDPVAEVQRLRDAAAPASQDAQDAARYRWLTERFGTTGLPTMLERGIPSDYIADGKDAIDAAIDAALAAQQAGGQ